MRINVGMGVRESVRESVSWSVGWNGGKEGKKREIEEGGKMREEFEEFEGRI